MMGNEDDNSDSEQYVPVGDIQELRKDITANPYDYNLRVHLIDALRSHGCYEELRNEREAMRELFLLPPSFWMEWINEESARGSDKNVIKDMFEKAVKDFHCPDLYVEFVQFACGLSISYARQKMEEMVNVIGRRYDRASLVWNVYIDFEKTLLGGMEGQEAEHQKALIIKIYRRALRVPHLGIDETWKDYVNFCGNDASKNDKFLYNTTIKRMLEISEFERDFTIAETVQDKVDCLMGHIERLKSANHNDRGEVQMLFERALTESASDPHLSPWLSYGSWVDYELKIPSIALDVYERGIKHNPCASVWQQYLVALERDRCDEVFIDSKWPEAREMISCAEEGVSLYRTYTYMLRRRESKLGNYVHTLKLLAEGMEYLRSRFGSRWDSPNANYRRNYAYFLYKFVSDVDKARSIWNDILSSGNGHLASVWLEAFRLEIAYGDASFARKLLYKAINSASDHPYQVYEALVQFEREFGTIEELDLAIQKVNAQISRVSCRPPKRSVHFAGAGSKIDLEMCNDDEYFISPKRIRHTNDSQVPKDASNSRAHSSSSSVHSKVLKVDEDGFAIPALPTSFNSRASQPANFGERERTNCVHKLSEEDKSSRTLFISNLHVKVEKEEIEAIFPHAVEIRLPYKGPKKIHGGFGYVEFASEADCKAAMEKDRTPINGRPMYVSEYNPNEKGCREKGFRYSNVLEKNKLFLRNVHYEATKEQIVECFSKFGGILDVRIIMHKSGKPKGCAFVDFESEKCAADALKETELLVLGRKLSVFLSNPSVKQSAAPLATSHQRNKIDLVPRVVSRPNLAHSNGSETNLSNAQFRSFLK